ncbi:hypothetical protein B0H13DRAFT_1912845 [Mycena leptocephala]|nr:hypothetical protein B0H13DRAFT_1912845 [Mycena leptocephala]
MRCPTSVLVLLCILGVLLIVMLTPPPTTSSSSLAHCRTTGVRQARNDAIRSPYHSPRHTACNGLLAGALFKMSATFHGRKYKNPLQDHRWRMRVPVSGRQNVNNRLHYRKLQAGVDNTFLCSLGTRTDRRPLQQALPGVLNHACGVNARQLQRLLVLQLTDLHVPCHVLLGQMVLDSCL